MNILIIKPSSLGDVVQALPVLKLLRRKYPHARIDWLVNDALADILLDNPYLHTVHRWDRASWRQPRRFVRAFRNAASVVRRLRQTDYDVVIDLQGLLRSALLAFLSGGKTVIGFANSREMAPMFYRERVAIPTENMHSVDRYVLAVGGDVTHEIEFPMGLPRKDERSTEALLDRMGYDNGKPLVIFAPAARWPTKRWPAQNFAALAEGLVKKQGAEVGFVGSPGDAVLARRIVSLSRCRMMDFSARTTLKQLACLLREADVVVGNDSGPIHVAAALGTPVIGLYGPTSPLKTGPYGRTHTVLTSGLRCSPCFSRTCSISAECMRAISVESVFEACRPYLDKAKRKRGSH